MDYRRDWILRQFEDFLWICLFCLTCSQRGMSRWVLINLPAERLSLPPGSLCSVFRCTRLSKLCGSVITSQSLSQSPLRIRIQHVSSNLCHFILLIRQILRVLRYFFSALKVQTLNSFVPIKVLFEQNTTSSQMSTHGNANGPRQWYQSGRELLDKQYVWPLGVISHRFYLCKEKNISEP